MVGWVPMLMRMRAALIAELAREPKFKGVRPMLQDLPDDNWIANPAFAPAIEALIAHDLAFDALIFTRHVDAFETFATALSAFAHRGRSWREAADPRRRGGWQIWADGITRLARLPHVHCKLSGLATEASPGWTEATLQPYVDHLLQSFGPRA